MCHHCSDCQMSSDFDDSCKISDSLTYLIVRNLSEMLRRTCLVLGCQCLRLRDWLPYRRITDTSTCTTSVACGTADRQRWARYDSLFAAVVDAIDLIDDDRVLLVGPTACRHHKLLTLSYIKHCMSLFFFWFAGSQSHGLCYVLEWKRWWLQLFLVWLWPTGVRLDNLSTAWEMTTISMQYVAISSFLCIVFLVFGCCMLVDNWKIGLIHF